MYAIFNEEFFSKYTNSYTKKHKLYNKLLNRISSETKSSVSGSSSKNRSALVPILSTSIPSITNYISPHFPSLTLSNKFLSLTSSPVSKKLIVEVKEIDSNIEIQLLRPQ